MRADQPQKRHMSMWTASSFVVASMIGTGVFTSLGFQLNEIQSVFPLLMLWVLGGVIAFCGALAYSELGAALPRSGGEYHLLSRIIHPAVGFAGGFVSATVGFSAPAVLAAIALGNYISAVFPIMQPSWTAFFIIILIHGLHSNSLKWGTFFQDWSTAIKVGLLILFIIAGFLVKNPESISIMPKTGDWKALLGSGFAVSLVWVSYAYTGWNSTIYIAGEVKNPLREIPRSLLISTGFVTLLYVLLNFIFLHTAPMDALAGKVEVGYISGVFVFGHMGAKIMAIGISILLLSTVSSLIYIGPRIMQTMGEDHSYIKILARQNSNGIPIYAFVLQLVISMIFLLTSSFEQVLMYSSIALILTTTITVFSLFVLRRREPDLPRPYKAWGYPWTPILFLIVNIWILYYTFQEKPIESLIGVLIFLFSFGLFYFGRAFEKQNEKQIN